MVRSLSTWLWLIEVETANRALDASDLSTGELAASLAGHFAEVDVLRASGHGLERVRTWNEREGWAPRSMMQGTLQTAAWPAETFDCIALHDSLARRNLPTPALFDELTDLHRLLRRGGWLAMASAHPPALRLKRVGQTGISRRRLVRLLTRARFREVRCLFVDHAIETPVFLVPDARPAILAYETSGAMRGSAGLSRRVAAALGLRSVLYPSYVLLARA